MPAPTSPQIQMALKTALLAQGFTKRSFDANGALVEDKSSLPPMLEKFVAAVASGDNVWFQQWESTQSVVIPVTGAPGTPSVAPPPLALP